MEEWNNTCKYKLFSRHRMINVKGGTRMCVLTTEAAISMLLCIIETAVV